jgi:virginiamycin B lyase
MIAGESLASQSDNNVWFSETGGDRIGKIDPYGVITEYPMSGSTTQIARLWSAASTACCIGYGYLALEPNSNQLIGFSPGSPSATQQYVPPTSNAGLMSITTAAVDPTGGTATWFSEFNVNQIAELSTVDPSYPTPREFAMPTGAGPTAMGTGSDNTLWVAEATANKIARIGQTFTLTEYPLPSANAGITAIATAGTTLDAPNVVYLAEAGVNKIAGVTSSGIVTEYTIPSANSGVNAITTDGVNVWFTEPNTNKIGEMSPSGAFIEYTVPTQSAGLAGISTASAGSGIYFTEENANKIGILYP